VTTDRLSEELAVAVDAAAATFDGRGSEVRERELEMALETALRTLGHDPRRQFRVRLEEAWSGRVGGVDLALELDDGPVLMELKWDARTLAACAWDQVKLAAALQSGEAHRAFLIAGSPTAVGFHGDELLDSGDVNPIGLRRRYAREFAFWKIDVKNRPRFAPACWRLALKHEAVLEIKGAPWRIRVAELELTSGDLVPFE
jgi:hypothetical protein